MNKQLRALAGSWRESFFGFGFLFFVSTLSYAACHRWIAVGFPRPIITCDQPLIELGAVNSNARIDCEFAIRNIGQRPLVVTEVRSGCGKCIEVVDFVQGPLQPGSSGLVRVRLLTSTLKSPQVKGVTVCSNAPVNPRYVLRVSSNL